MFLRNNVYNLQCRWERLQKKFVCIFDLCIACLSWREDGFIYNLFLLWWYYYCISHCLLNSCLVEWSLQCNYNNYWMLMYVGGLEYDWFISVFDGLTLDLSANDLPSFFRATWSGDHVEILYLNVSRTAKSFSLRPDINYFPNVQYI